jgi:hypothetical protein
MLPAELISDKLFQNERRDLVAIQHRASWLSHDHGPFEASSPVIVRHNDAATELSGLPKLPLAGCLTPPSHAVLLD